MDLFKILLGTQNKMLFDITECVDGLNFGHNF